MKKYTNLVIYILISLVSLTYIFVEVEDRADSFIVGYNEELKDELFNPLDDGEIDNLVREISDNLIKRKSAKKKNQEMVIEKFRKKGLIDSEEEDFIRKNLIIKIDW